MEDSGRSVQSINVEYIGVRSRAIHKREHHIYRKRLEQKEGVLFRPKAMNTTKHSPTTQHKRSRSDIETGWRVQHHTEEQASTEVT